MCGIAGIIDLEGAREIPKARLAAMTRALAHRGPDGEGVHLEPGLALGHRRLATLDPDGGAQPFYSPDRQYILLFNGLIYNFRELAAELERRGRRFATRCDTEVVLHAYLEWGEDCVDRFVGMFAIALWDAKRRRLFCARDRFGEKPFYYTRTKDGFFLFASELGAIEAALDETPELAPDAIQDYFAYGFVPDPKTIYRNIHKLAPAHRLSQPATPELTAPRPYWRLDFTPSPELARCDDDALSEELIARFQASVEGMLVADVPLGAFLSGGVDSSGVVAMMAAGGAREIETCSIGFDDPNYDESAYAREVAALFGTRHHEKTISFDAFELIDKIAQAYGEPFADPSAFPTYLVSGVARERVVVSLSGDGGDEIFGGYRRYAFHVSEERIKARIPGLIRRPIFSALAGVYPKLDWAPRALRAKATFEALSKDAVGGYFRALAVTPEAIWRRLRGEALDRDYAPIELARSIAEAAPAVDPLSRIQTIDLGLWLPGGMLTKVDRASMAHGLEVRAPFLDHRFAEWAAGLPASRKIEGFEGKAALKRALEPYLPRHILYRPKQGFSAPIADWLRGPLRDRLYAAMGAGVLEASGALDMPTLRALADAHIAGARDHSRVLWSVLMFDAFLRRDRAAVATAA